MPYLIAGFDSAGVPVQVTLEDDGTLTGDAMLTDWLAQQKIPDPPEGTPPHVPGDPLSDERLEQIRQHVSRLLTYTHIGPPPAPVEPPLPEPEALAIEPQDTQPVPRAAAVAGTHVASTAAELEALTVTDLRELASEAQIAGASSMTKAALVTALQAHQRSGSER